MVRFEPGSTSEAAFAMVGEDAPLQSPAYSGDAGDSDILLEFWRQALDDAVVARHLRDAYRRLKETVAANVFGDCEGAEAASRAEAMIELHDGMAALQTLKG